MVQFVSRFAFAYLFCVKRKRNFLNAYCFSFSVHTAVIGGEKNEIKLRGCLS